MSEYFMHECLRDYQTTNKLLKSSPADLKKIVAAFIHNIKTQNQAINAFVRLYDQEAKAKAEQIIAKIKEEEEGKVAGLVVGIKDLLCYEGHPVQGASKILEGFISQITATCVSRLLKEDGIVIGHHNCDEFGMGAANEYSVYGPSCNPVALDRVPGGSSGGSAAAVKAGMCHLALGTDTGGSVRQPAAFCGIIGFKPTYGLIPRYGVLAYASSFDTVGILGNSIPDIAQTLEIVAGYDNKDNTAYQGTIPSYSQRLTWSGSAHIASLQDAINHEKLAGAIKDSCYKILDRLKQENHLVEEVGFDLLDYVVPTYYILTTAEARANLARYDGVRYGYRDQAASNYQDMVTSTRTRGFGNEVKRRILLGTAVLSAEWQDAYYRKAQKVRRKIKESLHAILEKYDFILLPTTPTTASKLGENSQNPVERYLADLYTVIASAAGLPAISIPYGVDDKGLPIGIQIIGKAFQEEKLLAFAHYLIQLTKKENSTD